MRLSHQKLPKSHFAGNILLDGSGVVKVADFGLSRLQAATYGEPLTAELGTWQWMAPEVVAPWDKRGAVYTEKADVYSFGIVMWECAAREVMQAASSHREVLSEVLKSLSAIDVWGSVGATLFFSAPC